MPPPSRAIYSSGDLPDVMTFRKKKRFDRTRAGPGRPDRQERRRLCVAFAVAETLGLFQTASTFTFGSVLSGARCDARRPRSTVRAAAAATATRFGQRSIGRHTGRHSGEGTLPGAHRRTRQCFARPLSVRVLREICLRRNRVTRLARPMKRAKIRKKPIHGGLRRRWISHATGTSRQAGESSQNVGGRQEISRSSGVASMRGLRHRRRLWRPLFACRTHEVDKRAKRETRRQTAANCHEARATPPTSGCSHSRPERFPR